MENYFSIPAAQAGVITDAIPISSVLVNVLKFLLSIAGVVAIIGLIIAGALYFFAAGDEKRIELAKRAFLASLVGIGVALAAWVLVSQITAFFS